MVVFTGKKHYVTKKLNDLRNRGYVIVRSHVHPDGSETYVMTQKILQKTRKL